MISNPDMSPVSSCDRMALSVAGMLAVLVEGTVAVVVEDEVVELCGAAESALPAAGRVVVITAAVPV